MEHSNKRKIKGESAFAFILCIISLCLLWQSYKISGFEALSSSGAIPLFASSVMVLSAIWIFIKSLKVPLNEQIGFFKNILTPPIIILILMITAYAFLLKPVGFLITSFIFLIVSIKFFSKYSMVKIIWVSVLNLALIYIVFRLIFGVILPEGIIPEKEMIHSIRNFIGGL